MLPRATCAYHLQHQIQYLLRVPSMTVILWPVETGLCLEMLQEAAAAVT